MLAYRSPKYAPLMKYKKVGNKIFRQEMQKVLNMPVIMKPVWVRHLFILKYDGIVSDEIKVNYFLNFLYILSCNF